MTRQSGHFATTLGVMAFWGALAALAYWLFRQIDPDTFLVMGRMLGQ